MMRSLGSISSELCEMQKLRDSNIALSLKDAEWQRLISRPAAPSPRGYLAPYPLAQMPSKLTPSHAKPVEPPPSPTPSSTPSESTPSGSTHPPSPPQKPRSHTRGIGKIRRHRMTKEEEARFSASDLVDLSGSTAAQSRKMTGDQRDIMLHKRRLRNRLSAARSRDKQRKTISDVGDEIDQLVEKTEQLEIRCTKVTEQMQALKDSNRQLLEENEQLKRGNAILKNANNQLKNASVRSPPQKMRSNPSTLHLSLSTDMLDRLDKMIAAPDPLLPSPSDSLYKIPSRLRLSLSTDKLNDALMPAITASLPPLSRNVSIMDRLLDFANNNNNSGNINNTMDNIDINNPVHVQVKQE